ncbi:MAG: LptA/OstA family protein [Puniceicoccales bacterium]
MKHLLSRTCLFLLGLLPLAASPLAAQGVGEDTVVTSDKLEMVGKDEQNHFFFQDNVVVTGTNLKATCDEMTVIASRVTEQAAVGELGTITSITLVGHVVIEQSGRRAESGRAEIFPREGKVVLTEDPVVYDSEGTVKGERIELYKNEKKARVFGAAKGQPGKRPTVTLPSIGDMGYKEGSK